jgi:phospholipid N-methyltransferase
MTTATIRREPRAKCGATPTQNPALAHEREAAVTGSLRFLTSFLRQPLTVGAFWPSSRALAKLVIEGCDLPSRRTIVELGPGIGSFTELILSRIRRDSRFLAIELNEPNARELKRRFPQLEVHHDSAANLPACLSPLKDGRADCIVSGLAWGNMLPATQDPIMNAILASLEPGGLFTTFGYVHAVWYPTSLRLRRWLRRNFARVETTPIIWGNLPPAFVYRCWLPP